MRSGFDDGVHQGNLWPFPQTLGADSGGGSHDGVIDTDDLEAALTEQQLEFIFLVRLDIGANQEMTLIAGSSQ